MILATVTYKTIAGLPREMDGGDHEARHDAQRCVSALKKQYSEWEFRAKPGPKSGTWLVEGDIGVAHSIYVEMKGFAMGFMASAHLWER